MLEDILNRCKHKVHTSIFGLIVPAVLSLGCNSEPQQPVQTSSSNSDRVYSELVSKYGAEAVDFAYETVERGQELKKVPLKECIALPEHPKCTAQFRLSETFPELRLPRLFGFFDEERELEILAELYTARNRVLQRKDAYLPLTFIASVLAAEGFSLDLDHKQGNNLSGFGNYGLDHIGKDVHNLIDQGYLDSSFTEQIIPQKSVNELGHEVVTAIFKDKSAAFEAVIATLAQRQHMFERRLDYHNIDENEITPEEKLFFTYAGYNCTRQAAFGILRKKSAQEVHDYYNEPSTKGCKYNARRVVAGHLWLEQSGAFKKN